MKRPRRNLGSENIDFDLTPKGPDVVPYWLEDGPSAGTQVKVPVGTEVVFVHHPPPEVALTRDELRPHVAIYERDLNSAGGGFNVFRYRRSEPIG